MAIEMSVFYAVLTDGVDDPTSSIPIENSRTMTLRCLIDDIDDIGNATACIRALLLRYPEPELLDLSLQRLLVIRPQSLGPEYKRWKNEVYDLSLTLRGHSWEGHFRQRIKATYSKVAMNIWGVEALRVAS